MDKRDTLRNSIGTNAAESMGAGRSAPLFPGNQGDTPMAALHEKTRGTVRSKSASEIPVDRIIPDPNQPRQEFDPEALAHLAASIRARGQLQAIRVRYDEGAGLYVVVSGERRWRAAQLAGIAMMSCLVVDRPMTDAEVLADQLVENLLREDLRPIEQARGFLALMTSNSWTMQQVADELAITQGAVSKSLALLDLAGPVRERVEAGEIAPATGVVLSRIDDPEEQARVADRVVAEGLTRDEAAEAVREAKATKSRMRPAEGKSRGAAAKATPATLKPRTFRTSVARITIEPKPRSGADAYRLAVAELLALLGGTAESAGAA